MKEYIANVRIRKQDRNGNTYHDVMILDMNGYIVCECEKEYGYGQAYKQTTAELLNNATGSSDYNYYNIDEAVIFIDHRY